MSSFLVCSFYGDFWFGHIIFMLVFLCCYLFILTVRYFFRDKVWCFSIKRKYYLQFFNVCVDLNWLTLYDFNVLRNVRLCLSFKNVQYLARLLWTIIILYDYMPFLNDYILAKFRPISLFPMCRIAFILCIYSLTNGIIFIYNNLTRYTG